MSPARLIFGLTTFATLTFASACSDPKPVAPPAKPQVMAPIAIPTEPELTPEEAAAKKAQVDAQLARDLLALGAGPAPTAAPDAAAAAPAKRKVRRMEFSAEPETAEVPEDPAMLSDAQFQSALGNWRGVKTCLAQQATPQQDTSGALKIKFTISGQGAVVTSQVYDFSNDSARNLADCLEREARRVKFPTFTSAEAITKEAKFVF
jgi:hypothetical protein